MAKFEFEHEMISCLLCEKKFKTIRGLASHLTRIHDVCDDKQRFSLYIIGDFFPLIEKKSWTKAENLLQQINKEKKTNEWMKGYIHALEGMISALKGGESSNEPYIFNLRKSDYKKLQEVKKMFNEFAKKSAYNRDFDTAYFQAWNDYTYYLINSKI
jgi:hypothetical protein